MTTRIGLTDDPAPRRILLVEDHPVTRLGLRSVIDSVPDLEVIAEAQSARETVELVARHRPDLVVLPLRLEGELQGIELCRELVSSTAAPKVVIYSSYNAAEDASASFLSGAHGFVHKSEPPSRLIDTIRAAIAGRRVWLLGIEPNDPAARPVSTVATTGLTPRETEVLGLMLQHLSNAHIAQELFIGLPTVKSHVRSVLAKLGISSRRELF